jgi:DNA-binding beta-propeller fold protein YncE
VVVFDASGKFLRSWGKGLFSNPHGFRIDRNGHVWTTDTGTHMVMELSTEGQLLRSWGTKGKPGATHDSFNRPTDIAFLPNGDFFVTDGYGNSRVVKFSADGKYLLEWGKRGRGPGEFNTPHSIVVDSHQNVYVSDRENNRIQIFDSNGKFLASGPTSALPREWPYHPKTSCGSSLTGTTRRILPTTRWRDALCASTLPPARFSARWKVRGTNWRSGTMETFSSPA